MSIPAPARLRIAAIRFLNPAPLMWDFEHPPLNAQLASRYQVDWMLPSECADRLAAGTADIGLVPVASLAVIPGLRVLPGCTIASKHRVRSLLLVRRAHQPLQSLRTVAADMASRTTIAHARILFHHWGNRSLEYVPMPGDLDRMLDRADAAIVIGDPALLALEERANREERAGEELAYHDLAEEWRALTGLPFVSAVWGGTAYGGALEEMVINDLVRSRDHGLKNIDALVAHWADRLPLPEDVIRSYFTSNIHYVLDEECQEGMRCFFRKAAELGILPAYEFSLSEIAA
ncbi:MAG TPA: menaquinone biosynthesis protein [Candidatus Sulfopaludibacter sp.]|nr:menaquinone biosynthesis protein [Candidatus Sulfopaludibacter sp.]